LTEPPEDNSYLFLKLELKFKLKYSIVGYKAAGG